MMWFDVANVSLSIDTKEILSEVSLSVGEGQFIGIVGPNGSGKSTLLKCLYKTMSGYSGKIHFAERDLKTWKIRDVAKKNAVVAQVNDMKFDFTVLEMVLMGREPHKEWWQKENERDVRISLQALSDVGLSSYSDTNFTNLSGGEKQRVILARALAQEADCLILDEPTNHLDVANQLAFMKLVKGLPLTVISVIHDLNLAANYCDYVYALKEGQVATSGTPRQVFTSEKIASIFDVDAEICTISNQLQIVYLIQ